MKSLNKSFSVGMSSDKTKDNWPFKEPCKGQEIKCPKCGTKWFGRSLDRSNLCLDCLIKDGSKYQ